MKVLNDEEIKNDLNIPNLLTIIRILLVPVYIVLFSKGMKYEALTVFIIASLTDLLDGMIARKYNQITNFGKLMDPLADKLMILTAMFSMAIGNNFIPAVIPWLAVIILIVKEVLLVVGGIYMLKKHIVVYSHMIGKVAHCVFIAGLIATYFHDYLENLFTIVNISPDLLLIWLAVILTIWALIHYLMDSVKKLNK